MKKLLCWIGVAAALSVGSFLQAVPATFISPDQITSSPFSITSPGLYVLTDDVPFDRSGGTAITISANDVILDLHSKTIINTGAGTENGISLASTLTNVTIQNGALRSFDGMSINVNAGCVDINFQNLTIVGTSVTLGQAFNFAGTSGSALRTSGVRMTNCRVSNSNRGILATATDNVAIYNSTFNANGDRSISVVDCDSWNLDTCQVSLNGQPGSASSDAFGLIVSGGKCWTVKNSDFSGNAALGAGGARGVITQPSGAISSAGHIFDNCTFCNNRSVSGSSRGMHLVTTHSVIVKNCIANGNFSSASNALGFSFQTSLTGMVMENCIGSGNTSALDAFGVQFQSIGGIIRDSQFNQNFSKSGNAFGITVSAGGLALVERCVCCGNAGVSGATRGIQIGTGVTGNLVRNCVVVANSNNGIDNGANTGSSNLFIGNISFGHGASNYVGSIPFVTVAATGPYPLFGTFDNRSLANLSFT